MADYFNTNFPAGGYRATHKGNRDLYGDSTPNFEIMEGMRFGQFYPAAYLPILRYERVFQDRIVLAAGMPVALDSNNDLVPAGLKLAIAAGKGNGPQYTQEDVDMGVLNAEGDLVSAGDYVVDSMIDAGLTVGACMGVSSYDGYIRAGADPTNPATYRFHNYNRQTGIAVLTDYLLEFPIEPFERKRHKMTHEIAGSATDTFSLDHDKAEIVAHSIRVRINGRRDVEFALQGASPGELKWADAAYLKVGDQLEVTYQYEVAGTYNTPFSGMSTWRGDVAPGDFVTFDMSSAWVRYEADAIGDTSGGDEGDAIAAAIAKTLDIVGQVTLVDHNFPKQFLDRVKTAHDSRLNGPIVDGRTGQVSKLDRMPGSATDGAPHNVFYAGGDTHTGIVRFNMNIR